MARPALDKLSRNELLELQFDVEETLKRREADDRAAVKAEMIALATKRGLSLEEILGMGRSNGRGKGSVAVKYRNPDNPTETWTGRGRQPRWLVAFQRKGGKLEKCLIK